MKKFLVLIKIAAMQSLLTGSGSKNKKKSKAASAVTTAVIYAVLGVLLAFMFGSMYFGMVMIAREQGDSGAVFSPVTVANVFGTVMTLFLATMGLSAHVFKCRDFDMLMAMPVTPSQVLHSKLVGQYLALLYYSAVFLLPAYIVIFAAGGVGVTFGLVLTAVANILFLPLIPLSVAVILAFFVSLIPENNAVGKAFSVILSLGLLGVYMWFFYGGDGMTAVMTDPSVVGAMKTYYFPLAFLDGVFEGSALGLLLYIAVCAVIYAAVVGVLSFAYFPIVRRRKHGSAKKKKLEKGDIKASRVGAALYVKELKKYFGTTVYVVNTIIGPLLLLGGSFYLVFGNGSFTSLMKTGYAPMVLPILVLVQSFTLGLGCTTAASVSLEGKSLWILRTAPVSAKKVFAAKIGVCLTVLLPCSVGGSLVFAFGLGLDALTGVLTVVSGVLLSLTVACLGLLANLRFPRFDYVNEAQAVKQGASVIIGMFLPTLIMLPFVVCAFLLPTFGIVKGGLVPSLVVICAEVVFFAVVAALLSTKGKKLYERL